MMVIPAVGIIIKPGRNEDDGRNNNNSNNNNDDIKDNDLLALACVSIYLYN